MSRGPYRTSRLTMWFRVSLVPMPFVAAVTLLFESWYFLFWNWFICFVVAAAMMTFAAAGTYAVCWLLYRNDPQYREFLATGGSPWYDLVCIWPVNCDPKIVRYGSRIPEPEYTLGRMPDPDWQWQCLTCGARCPTGEGLCWNCGHDLGTVVQPHGRSFNCYNCGKQAWERTMGALDRGGVCCPHCGAINVALRPGEPPRGGQ